MSRALTTLSDICIANLLHTKWLLAPSHHVGHQWIETLVRSGRSTVNLHPTTVSRLALEVVGPQLAADGLTLASSSVGALIVDATWHQLKPDGYLGRLQQSIDLSSAIFDSLSALRLAGCSADDIVTSHLESEAKANDIVLLLKAYETFLKSHALVDDADILRLAIARISADPTIFGDETVVLIPAGLHLTGLERKFANTLPDGTRIEISHPAERPESAGASTDIRLLGNIGRNVEGLLRKGDGSVQLFRAVGEVNEVREVLRRALSEKLPLDDIEVLHTDSEIYVPLVLGMAHRHFSEPDRPGNIPVTFAEGIPVTLSRPGRALAAWLQWIREDYPQRLLVEMLGEGLLDCGDEEELSFSFLKRLLRPIAIGKGANHYLPKLDEQIKALGPAPAKTTDDPDDNAYAVAAHERKLKGLKALRKLTRDLLSLSHDAVAAPGPQMLKAAEKFLTTKARSVSELDRFSTDAIVKQLEDRQLWLERLDLKIELYKWVVALPAQTRVLRSGPRPGHLHVAHVDSGGQSGRGRTFVVGLDDRRFPGAALQDPVLLDRERARLSPELPTSADRLRRKIDSVAVMLSRLGGSVTLSWPCLDLADDRESFPSSVVLAGFRLVSGNENADLESLNDAVGPPVSFAPTTAEKALNESERWLWQLSREDIQGTNQVSNVEAFFPHLVRGRAARLQRLAGFGPFNGYVPQAGADLNPFSVNKGSVLSASALETAGRCPLAFFFRNGLKLYKPKELEIDQDHWIDSAQFGSLMHDVFRHFMHELSCTGRRPEFERDHTRLAMILNEAVEQWRNDVPPPNENAFRMQYWQLIRTARIFLQAEEEFCRTSQPRFFEVALGLESVASGSPLDKLEASVITLPSGRTIQARGQIDRVDETGMGQYSVWDYKISSGYGYDQADPFRQGRRVQNVLYLRMIELAIRHALDPKAHVGQFGYFFPSIRAHGLRVDWNADELSGGVEILEQICESVEAGAFVATDQVDDCRFCDYASICRNVNQVTSHSKYLLDRDDLVPLKHFRGLRHE